MLEIKSLNFGYDNQNPLFNTINVRIAKGKTTVFMGQSGCGKSTLLHLMNAIEKPVKGTIKNASTRSSFIFQDTRLVPWFTIYKNITFGAKHLKVAHTEQDVDNVMELLGLPLHLKSAYPKVLSGGMAQRVNVARALLCKPDLLLMDEPFSALDMTTKKDIMARLTLWIKTNTCTTVFVTHSAIEASTLGDVIYYMSGKPAVIKNILTISTPNTERPQKMIESTSKNLSNEIQSLYTGKHTSNGIISSDTHIAQFMEKMTGLDWKFCYLSDTDTDLPTQRPDCVIISTTHPNIDTIINTYKDAVTRFLFIQTHNNANGESVSETIVNAQKTDSALSHMEQWWGWHLLYQALISDIPETPITSLTVGMNWTFITTPDSSGLARSPSRGTEGARTVNAAGDLHTKNLRQLAELITHDDDISRSIGIAATNAHYHNTVTGDTIEENWGFRVLKEFSGDIVSVGNFPPAAKIIPHIKVIEREPKEGHYTVEQGEDVLPSADVLIVTAQTLMNGSLPRILFLAQNATVMLLGPTAPLTPLWKEYGVRYVCAVKATSTENMLNFVSQAGSMLIKDNQAEKVSLHL